ncbi:MAG: tRNA 2-thiouridine(34) synthase MnmA [Chlamydiia bacterium]|nr:tRNA 2-thiouridine(34) synthase MnmA [Chlamydiia bacterium]
MTFKESKTVFVAVSGGVDSSVSICLMKEAGYKVVGLYMRNWRKKFEDEYSDCNQDYEIDDAIRVCKKLEIPFYVVDLSEEYKKLVFDKSIDEMKKGLTPNPDVWCNKYIKFDIFAKKAFSMGADYIATGHYCTIVKKESNWFLCRGRDKNKDQSYFLYAIEKDILKRTVFPIGNMEKEEVREIAKQRDLHVHDKKDSVGICFVGKRRFSDFIGNFIEDNPGHIYSDKGDFLGVHKGLHFYTLGQRKGTVSGKACSYYVLRKDIESNQLIVTKDEETLLVSSCKIENINMLVDEGFLGRNSISCKIRYRSPDVQCRCIIKNNIGLVDFMNPVASVTPGQSLVMYSDNICIGGGIVTEVFMSAVRDEKNNIRLEDKNLDLISKMLTDEKLVVAMPTDTIYGMCASVKNASAIDKIQEIKGRSENKKLVILVGSIEEALSFWDKPNLAIQTICKDWPDRTSVVFNINKETKKKYGVSGWDVAVRLVKRGDLLNLLKISGPLYATSINKSGEPHINDHEGVLKFCNDNSLSFIEGEVEQNEPSIILKVDEYGKMSRLR